MKNYLTNLIAGALAFAVAALPLPALAQNMTMPGTVTVTPGTANESASYASTLANKAGTITIVAPSIGAGGVYAEVITNTAVSATDVCFGSVQKTSGVGNLVVAEVIPAANALTVTIKNTHQGSTFNGTALLSYICFK